MNSPRDEWHFPTHHIGLRVLVFDELASTNDRAAEYAASLENAGLVLLAEHQTAGRGQYGRVWQSKPNASALVSVVVNPRVECNRPVILTAWAACSIANTIATLTGAQARLKWPNDLLISGRKICGILIEQSAGAHRCSTIAGIGLNVNQTAEEFATNQLHDATSLSILSQRTWELRDVLAQMVQSLDEQYALLESHSLHALEQNWKQRIGLLAQTVQVELMDGQRAMGRLQDITFDGIELANEAGGMQSFRPEWVRQLKPAS